MKLTRLSSASVRLLAIALAVAICASGAVIAAAYESGPVIHRSDAAATNEALYDSGPVIHPGDLFLPYTEEPYAPYEAGPVIHPSDLFLPYTEERPVRPNHLP